MSCLQAWFLTTDNNLIFQAPEILNNAAFQEVLAFQRGSRHRDKDIERPNTAIMHIKLRADQINKELAAKLQVFRFLYNLSNTYSLKGFA